MTLPSVATWTVRWTNNGDSDHTSTRVGVYSWNSPRLDTGGVFSKAFISAGSYPYFCALHSGMTGSVNVLIRTSATSGTLATTFTLTWASVTAPSGFRYVVQKRNPGSTVWGAWKSTTAPSGTFKATVKGTYSFRAKLQRISDGAGSGWSPVRNLSIT